MQTPIEQRERETPGFEGTSPPTAIASSNSVRRHLAARVATYIRFIWDTFSRSSLRLPSQFALVVPELVRPTRWQVPLAHIFGELEWTVNIRNAGRLTLRPFAMDLSTLHEIWDAKVYAPPQIVRDLAPGTTIDIGAQIGMFSVFALKRMKMQRIIAYEPEPRNFELLLHNIQLAGGEAVIVAQQQAVSDVDGRKKLWLNPDNFGGHRLVKPGEPGLEVQSTTLGALLQTHSIGECAVLKMDCEGSEFSILKSCPDSALMRCKRIVLEYHLDEDNRDDFAELCQRLERLGFDRTLGPRTAELGILVATRRDLSTPG